MAKANTKYYNDTGYHLTLMDQITGVLDFSKSPKNLVMFKFRVSVGMSLCRCDKKPRFLADSALADQSRIVHQVKSSSKNIKIITEYIAESDKKSSNIITMKVIDMEDGSVMSSGTHIKFMP